MERFVVVDVETANRSRASICQIGLVVVEGREIVEEVQTLIDPDQAFDPMNISIHGITPEDVRSAPTFRAGYEEIEPYFYDAPVLGHSNFDKAAFRAEFARWGMANGDIHWADTIPIIRKGFPKLEGGYSLKNLTTHFGISFKHHDALEDARAAAQITLMALDEIGLAAWDVMKFER
jgi:DNA polymerase-3 subunit epsilon